MSERNSSNTSRPRTGGKENDRKDHGKNNKDNRGGNKSGDRKGNLPKYDDTQEAKTQKNKIHEIDSDIIKVQNEISKLDNKVKVVRKPRVRLTDKESINKEIETLTSRLSKEVEEVKTRAPNAKKLLDVVNDKRSAVNRLKIGVFYNNIANDFMKINEQRLREEVKRLETRLETETLSIGEEKVVVREIKNVKAMKQNFEPYLKRAQELRDAEQAYGREDRDMKKRTELIETYNKQISELKSDLSSLEQREKEAKQLEEQEKKKQVQVEEKEKDEKTKLGDKLTELLELLRKEKENLRNNRDKWYQSKRDDRNKKFELINKEREESRKEKDEQEREKVVQARLERKLAVPFDTEIATCQNLIIYLNELLSQTRVSEPKVTSTENKEEKKDNKDQGYIKGKDEIEDLLFPESTGQKKKKKVQKKKKVSQKITHTWDTFTRFEEIGLGEPPISAPQIPAAIESVKSKLAEFQKKSSEEKVKILKEIEEEEKQEKQKAEEDKKRSEEEKKNQVVEEPKKEEGTTQVENK